MKKMMLILSLAMGFGISLSAGDITTPEGAKKACDGGDAVGCYNLGIMYAKGQGVRQSNAKAKALFGKACDGGHADGCYNYAILNKK